MIDERDGGMRAARIKCGSEPARDEAITFNILVECYTAIASRLAPTGDVADRATIADARSFAI